MYGWRQQPERSHAGGIVQDVELVSLRGAGNLLGEEQSGHIKEVGFELYQQMLEEAVAELKGDDALADRGWSPQITVGTTVMIPESYVPDLHLRLALYRRDYERMVDAAERGKYEVAALIDDLFLVRVD